MANKQIFQLTANTTPATTYLVPLQDAAGSAEAVKTTLAEFKAALSLNNVDNTSDATKNAASVTLTNKTIALGSNTISGTLAQLNTAITDADVVSLAGSETLTNKSISGSTNTLTNIPESAVTGLVTDLAGKQPLNSNLTTIAGLTATTDNFLMGAASAWASRTPAQARTSLGLVIGTNVQAWDADLDALAALSGTNNIYYRSAANTWSPVTIGANLTFTGGTLAATGGGGGGGTWGSITGTLSSQTDLQNALNLKKSIQVITQASHGFTPGMAVQKNTSGVFIRSRAVTTSNLSYADGVIISVPDANTFILGAPGDFFDATGLGLATNTVYYLDTTSSGINYNATAPSAIGEVYKELFRTNAANQAYIMNWPGFEITTATSGSGGGNKYWQYQQWEHFTLPPQTTVNGSSFVHATSSGTTGAGFTTVTVAPSTMTGYVGVITGTTGTTATGWASLGQGNYPNNFRFDGNGKIRFMTKLYIDTLRDGTEDYRIVVGFTDGIGNGNLPADGAYFIYSSANAAWQYVTSAASVRTTNTSSVTVSALTTYILEVEYNGAGGFNFYINGVLANVSPITTTAPVTSANATALGAMITKTAGTTARTVNIDWMALGVDFE